MSDKEWYEGLMAEELEGKHVHAVYDYGTVVDGELCRNGSVRIDHRDEDGAPVFVIDEGLVVNTFAHILSVSLVWDERDWEQIRTEDISEADAIVVNGRLLHVDTAYPDYFFTREGASVSTPVYAVSHALRRKYALPTEPGTYRTSDGTQILCRLEDCDSWTWVAISSDAKSTQVNSLSDRQAAQYMPLTPVHFVDGRAE